MSRRERRDMVLVAVVLAVSAGVLGWAQSARAGVNPPCQVTGHLEKSQTSPSSHKSTVTAVFHVAQTCREVSLLSWLAPDAHAGNPQVLYDRRSQSDVAPGDYRWTITRPADDCFQQSDLRVPGHNVDALLGGDHLCQPPSTTTTTTSKKSTITTEGTTTTTSPAPPTTTSTVVIGPANTTPPPSGETELPNTGGGELWALTLGAVGLIGLGRWSLWRGRRRAERL